MINCATAANNDVQTGKYAVTNAAFTAVQASAGPTVATAVVIDFNLNDKYTGGEFRTSQGGFNLGYFPFSAFGKSFK